jgi:3-dehydroquinate synthetase
MSFLSGHISEKNLGDIESLISKAGLPNKVSSAYKNAIAKKMLADKKNIKQQIKWVFLEDIGKVKVDVTLPNEIVNEGLDYILK